MPPFAQNMKSIVLHRTEKIFPPEKSPQPPNRIHSQWICSMSFLKARDLYLVHICLTWSSFIFWGLPGRSLLPFLGHLPLICAPCRSCYCLWWWRDFRLDMWPFFMYFDGTFLVCLTFFCHVLFFVCENLMNIKKPMWNIQSLCELKNLDVGVKEVNQCIFVFINSFNVAAGLQI